MPKEIATLQATPGWPKLVLRAKWAKDQAPQETPGQEEEEKNPCSAFYTEGMSFDLGTYKGGLLDGQPHGFGEQTCVDGKTYKGTWLNGKKHGSGKERNPANGIKYFGDWY